MHCTSLGPLGQVHVVELGLLCEVWIGQGMDLGEVAVQVFGAPGPVLLQILATD